MDLVSIRMPRETVEQLRSLARVEAARRNETVTWAGLVREVVEDRLLDVDAGRPAMAGWWN